MDAAAASGGDGDVSGDIGEGERGNQRESECVWELGREVGVRPRATARRGERRGGGQLRGTHAVLAAEHLPACLAEPSSSLARQLGWAGRWAG